MNIAILWFSFMNSPAYIFTLYHLAGPCFNFIFSFSFSTVRPSTPGNGACVYICAEAKVDGLHPICTCFAISSTQVLLCYHALIISQNTRFAVFKQATATEQVLQSDIIYCELSVSDRDEDWAVLQASQVSQGTPFPTSATLCPEAELPLDREEVGVKHLPVGVFNVRSSFNLGVQSIRSKIICYDWSERVSKRRKRTLNTVLSVVTDPAHLQILPPMKFVNIERGLFNGCCGAPYFNLAGKAFAMHTEGVNDVAESDSTSTTSHSFFSRGYVLCRLSTFVAWCQTQGIAI